MALTSEALDKLVNQSVQSNIDSGITPPSKPVKETKTLYKEMELEDGYRNKGFTGSRSQWSRNFGVDGLDSDGSNLANYIVRISRDDAKDKNGHIWGNQFITALMMNNISYNLSANWSVSNNQVSSMVQGVASGMLGAVAQFGGVELGSAGYTTRKIYKGGTDMSLGINIRLFDSTSNFTARSSDNSAETIDPNLTVMDGVKWINSIMLPLNKISLNLEMIDNFTSLQVEGKETDKEKTESAKKQEAAKKKIVEQRDNLSNALGGDEMLDTIDTITEHFSNELKSAEFNLTSTPPPVSILIGKWLYIDRAVITDASFNFSTEMTANGPLYCDVTLQVSTQENLMLLSDEGKETTDINRLKLFNAPSL